jgi:glycolate oxidase FAD binding subunit
VRAAHERMGGERIDPTPAAHWWNALRHHTHPIFTNSTVWRLSVPDTTPPIDLPGHPLIDWGGALRWYAYGGTADALIAREDARYSAAAANEGARARELATAAGGTALCWHGHAPPTGRFHPLQPAVASLHRRLKQHFDPHGIFNPGRMIPGL